MVRYILSLDPRVLVLGSLVPANEVGNLSDICHAPCEGKLSRVVIPILSRTLGSGDINITGVWFARNFKYHARIFVKSFGFD